MYQQQLFVSLQAYIKLGDFQKAVVDCEWALKVRRWTFFPHDGAWPARQGISVLKGMEGSGQSFMAGHELCSQSLGFLIYKMG